MQVTKYAFFLVLGITAQACGGGSDGDGGDGDTGGGTTGNGGSTGKGGATGNGGSSSGTTGNGGSSSGTTGNGGSSSGTTGNGGSSSGTTGNGGATSTGGSTGTGGAGGAGGACMAGEVDLFDDPVCRDFFTCYFEAICAMQGAEQQACIDATKQALQGAACAPADSDPTASCAQLKTIYAMNLPECQ
jgi:hypothetical protein